MLSKYKAVFNLPGRSHVHAAVSTMIASPINLLKPRIELIFFLVTDSVDGKTSPRRIWEMNSDTHTERVLVLSGMTAA